MNNYGISPERFLLCLSPTYWPEMVILPLQSSHTACYLPVFPVCQADELYLDDKKRRIDYVLAWPSGQKDEAKAKEAEDARRVFEENLTKEGLEIEHDIKVSITLCLHVCWQTLS